MDASHLKRTTGQKTCRPTEYMLLLNTGLGLIIPLHVRVFLAFRLRGGGGLGLSKGRRCEDGSDAQGNNGRDGFHGCSSIYSVQRVNAGFGVVFRSG